MGLTSALNTSLNGLAINETAIDVLGNNIANAGTNGFKASNVHFATQLARTISMGSAPSADNGGTNPRQVGLGATTAAIIRDFAQGSISNSTSPSDLAIQGNGFFILDGPEGTVYTRDGTFLLNSESMLVNPDGLYLQGYGVDDDFNLDTTQLRMLEIPLGDLNVAQETQNVEVGGALYAGGDVADRGTVLTSEVLTDVSTANPITGTTLLADVRNAGGQPLFIVGETLTFEPMKGMRDYEEQTLPITGTTTVDDWLTLMDEALGIQSGGSIPNDAGSGTQPGISIVGGAVQIVGNSGTVNGIEMPLGVLRGSSVIPLTFTETQAAVGESTITDFIVYDSLGESIMVRMSASLESRDSVSTTYRYFIESFDDSRSDVAIATGTMVFDSHGELMGDTSDVFMLQRDNTAALSPMSITLDYSKISGISTAVAGSALKLEAQDGSAPGTLQSYVIDESGVINGIFDNGAIRTLGQVALSLFANPQGLLEAGGTTYREGSNSGMAFVTMPGSFGAGRIRAGAIELSNTDIGRNLVDLIVASTNYRGNARVIGSVQELVDELLILGR